MVRVINASGLTVAMTSPIDLSPYLEDHIARLIGVRHLSRADEPFADHTHPAAAVATHTHPGEAVAAHTHPGAAVAAHTHPLVTIGGPAISAADHTHLGTATDGGGHTPTIQAGGAHTPTVQAGGAHTPTVQAGGGHTVAGMQIANRFVRGNGFLTPAATTPPAGTVNLTGPMQIHMGNAVAPADILEVRVLYFKEAAGVF